MLSQAQQGEGEPVGRNGAAAQTLHIAPRRSQQPPTPQRSPGLASATSYDPPAPLVPPPLPADENVAGGAPGGDGEGRSRGREADGVRRSGGGRGGGVAGAGVAGGRGGGGGGVGRTGSGVSDPVAVGNGGGAGAGGDPAAGTVVVACLVSFLLLLLGAIDGLQWDHFIFLFCIFLLGR